LEEVTAAFEDDLANTEETFDDVTAKREDAFDAAFELALIAATLLATSAAEGPV
jgi:hypothetical protein